MVYHDKNRGKGAALRTGFAHVSGDIVLIRDADLEYDPVDYPVLLGPILDGESRCGVRPDFGRTAPRTAFLALHCQQILTLVTNVLYNINLTDMGTCYKVFRSEIIKPMKLESNRFSSNPKSRPKSANKNCAFTKRPFPTVVHLRRRQKSHGKTASSTCGAC